MSYQPLFLSEEENTELSSEDLALVEEVLSEQKTVVRLSKEDRMKRLVATSSIAIARQEGDKLYHDLEKTQKRLRAIRERIYKKYKGKATTTARELMKNVGKGRDNKGMRDAGQAPE